MRIKTFFILTFFLISLSAISCNQKEETTPEMAKATLKIKGYKFNEEDFFKAIRFRERLVVNTYLNAKMSPNVKNKLGNTALTFAFLNSSNEIIEALVKEADINLQDDQGHSAIHLAIDKEKDKIFELLLKKEADVNVTGSKGATKNISALFAAVIKRREDLVKKLIEKKADPNIADSKGAFPLAEAAFQDGANPKIVKLLLDNGAEVNKQEKNGTTALIYAAANQGVTAEVRKQIIRMLLEKGADKSIKNKDGKTALDVAKELEYEQIIKMLE